MLLEGKVAVVYGGGGSIGRAMARAFAREGATVHLAGRSQRGLEDAAAEIRGAGGAVHTAQLDARDEGAVDDYADSVAAASGGLDVSVNAISLGEVFGTPLAELPLDDFERPILNAVRSTFLTSRAAARHMVKQRSGVILMFGGYGDPAPDFYLGGFQVALSAIDALRRQLAAELGQHGIRVLTLQSAGVPEAIPGGDEARDATTESVVSGTLLGRAASLDDVGNVAVFAASDHARAMTATKFNITCGAEVD
jgi:NAD(P)-dependent dehydrogenase (short-subunit alcohol dehydrogenase family)